MAQLKTNARERQKEIFIGGFRGKMPRVPISFDELEAKARQAMSSKAFAYIAGSAGKETTAKNNSRAFDKWHIKPRMLRDVSNIETSTKVCNTSLPFPCMLAPVGVLEMAHPKADKAVAQAAAAENTPYIFSNQASISMEDCAEVMGTSPRWFQLYWSKNNDLVKSFVKRAEQCGCEAIVLTVDTTMLGWRPRDLNLAYLPFLEDKVIAQYTSDPAFRKMVNRAPEPKNEERTTLTVIKNLIKMSRKYPGSFWKNLTTQKPLKAVKTFIDTYSRPSLKWDDLNFLRDLTTLPILLKGITHPKDALKAAECGMDGIIVSNHGGRQVDGAIPALEALPDIAKAVGADMDVLFDSGIRSGADIIKAIALGADAVLLGRPYAYALAIAGRPGVQELIKNFKADFELHLGLSGCRSIDELKTKNILPST
jgi:lactate 2-monooxygenase